MMTQRIARLCASLPRSSVFADVGCDHGYCTQYMLEHALCGRAYISDISAGSLSKAQALLSDEIASGRCIPVCADGMKGLPADVDCLLIAGMGGEEIVRILSEGYIPARFVLQPMKNAARVRAFLTERGCRIEEDITFCADGKFYDLIAGENAGGSEYSDWELKFGRGNLSHPTQDFLRWLHAEEEKLRSYLVRDNMSRESRGAVLARLYELEVIINAVEEDL